MSNSLLRTQWWRSRRRLLGVAGLGLVAVTVAAAIWFAASSAGGRGAAPQSSDGVSPSTGVAAQGPVLGENTIVFTPDMPLASIQARVDEISGEQTDDEMGDQRYALLFEPGTYGTDEDPLQLTVGYYTEVAGLGESPSDVIVNGKIEVLDRCFGADGSNCIALTNFWRSLSNLTVDVNGRGQEDCRASTNVFAVSQAVSVRRVDVTAADGPSRFSLVDPCGPGPHYASGGFIADSRLDAVENGSQQQWLTRNSRISEWSNASWNQVFAGVEGAPDDRSFPNPAYTTLGTTPLSREKPYLFRSDAGAYEVKVPSARRESTGLSWTAGPTGGRSVPLEDFFVATPGDSIDAMNAALRHGKNLMLTPGMYDVDRSIRVERPDTVVMGIGHATLTAVDGATPIVIADQPGIVVAGVTIDAGADESPALLQVGERLAQRQERVSDPGNPTTLSDVYLRVGGPHVGSVDTALEVNSDDVLIDNAWIWRADHGVEGPDGRNLSDDERWASVRGRNGLTVNGDRVVATGLFVEHFQEYNTTWNGEDGKVVLYQNELPYDPPSQSDWMNGQALGWPGYKVADDVRQHNLFGGGVYAFNQNDPSIRTGNGFEVPDAPGVRLYHVGIVSLSSGSIDHVASGRGGGVGPERPGQPEYLVEFAADQVE